jgi:hypothetical protein
MKWLGIFLLSVSALICPVHAQLPTYTWTSLIPENDSRPADMRKYDRDTLGAMVVNMNATEAIFHHELTWHELPIRHLLNTSAPFCEIDFDPLHPLVFTPEEKTILKEYLARGGFVQFGTDTYAYSQEEIASVTQWPIVDFITKELPAEDHDFTVEKINETHPLYRQYYHTTIPPPELWALKTFPHLPDCLLVSHKGHPCAFFYSNYYCDGGRWIVLDRPFNEDTDWIAEDYAMNVNLYIYTTMH